MTDEDETARLLTEFQQAEAAAKKAEELREQLRRRDLRPLQSELLGTSSEQDESDLTQSTQQLQQTFQQQNWLMMSSMMAGTMAPVPVWKDKMKLDDYKEAVELWRAVTSGSY